MIDTRDRRMPPAGPSRRRFAIRPEFLRRCRFLLAFGLVFAVAAIVGIGLEPTVARGFAVFVLLASVALALTAWCALRDAAGRVVEIGPDGVRARRGGQLLWTELAAVRDRSSLGQVELLDDAGRVRVRLDHQLDHFADAVEAVVAARTSVSGFHPSMTFRGRGLPSWGALASRVVLAAVPAAGWVSHLIRDPRWAFGLSAVLLLSSLEFVYKVRSLRVSDESVIIDRLLGRLEIPASAIVSCDLTPPTLRGGSLGVVLRTSADERVPVLPRGADATAVCAAVRSVCGQHAESGTG